MTDYPQTETAIMTDGARKFPVDEELIKIAGECRAAAFKFRDAHNSELTAALINYRAAQLVASAITDFSETVSRLSRPYLR